MTDAVFRKRDLELDKLLKKLSRFDVMMIDDFGYVKQDRAGLLICDELGYLTFSRMGGRNLDWQRSMGTVSPTIRPL